MFNQSNLQKMKELSRLLQERKLTRSQVEALVNEVARSTGQSKAYIRQLIGASKLMFG